MNLFRGTAQKVPDPAGGSLRQGAALAIGQQSGCLAAQLNTAWMPYGKNGAMKGVKRASSHTSVDHVTGHSYCHQLPVGHAAALQRRDARHLHIRRAREQNKLAHPQNPNRVSDFLLTTAH
jgi:hypothetical protein